MSMLPMIVKNRKITEYNKKKKDAKKDEILI